MKNVTDEIETVVSEWPDKPALVQKQGPDFTYSELWGAVLERSEQYENAGVGSGDRCGFFCEQGASFVIGALGILRAGGCFIPIPLDERGDADSEYIKQLQPHYLIDRQREFDPVKRSEVDPIDNDGDETFKALNPAYIRFTSGTTSDSQGVLLSHESILERTEAANRGLGVSSEDRILWVLPMVHHFVVSILLYLRFGATILLPESDLAGPQLAFARERQCTILYATPYQHRLFAKGADGIRLPDLRLAVSTASGLQAEVARAFQASFSVPLTQALGIIEAGLPLINLDRATEKPLSIGGPLPDYTVQLLDDDSQPIAGNHDRDVGEIAVDGPGLLDAYVSPWGSRDEVLGQHGFHTGDQGRIDEDGDYFLVGRRANRINLAGTKFFCEEVERELNRHPHVKVSRVRGRDHDHLGEIPVAEVVPSGELEVGAEELQEYCRERVDNHMVPRSIDFVDSIPRTETGKIKRRS